MFFKRSMKSADSSDGSSQSKIKSLTKTISVKAVAPAPTTPPKGFTIQEKLPAVYLARQWTKADVNEMNPYAPIFSEAISKKQVASVITSWKSLRKISSFETKAGVIIMRKIFKLSKPLRVHFGFPHNADPEEPIVYHNKNFVMHGMRLISMIDTTIEFLEKEDLESLELELEDLGRRHVRMKVMPDDFPVLGRALIQTLQTALGDSFNKKANRSWELIFHFIAYNMVRGLLLELAERSSPPTKIYL